MCKDAIDWLRKSSLLRQQMAISWDLGWRTIEGYVGSKEIEKVNYLVFRGVCRIERNRTGGLRGLGKTVRNQAKWQFFEVGYIVYFWPAMVQLKSPSKEK